MKIKVGEIIPNKKVFVLNEENPTEIQISNLLNNKKIILFGLPGAYTSVCSTMHLPGFINSYEQFKSKGIDRIICISVNDPFVMNSWSKANKVEGKILMIADPYLNFTKSIGAEVDKTERGLGIRSNRYCMLIDSLKVIKLEEEKNTGSCRVSAAENFLQLI